MVPVLLTQCSLFLAREEVENILQLETREMLLSWASSALFVFIMAPGAGQFLFRAVLSLEKRLGAGRENATKTGAKRLFLCMYYGLVLA